VIVFDQVTAGYGAETVLDRLSLTLNTGASTAVVGVSGGGKTTLLRVLAGLVEVRGGRLTVPEVSTGYVLQSLGLFPWKTVRQNIDLGLESLGLPADERRRRVDAVLADLGIAGVADKFPGRLSGGQAQRTALARTLVRRPGLLLLDEPTASLDALTREAFQDWLLGVHRRYPSTLITVTHGIEEAAVLGDEVVVLRKGLEPVVLPSPLADAEDRRGHPAFGPFCQQIRHTLGLGRTA